jgi:dienelactone hydrolase
MPTPRPSVGLSGAAALDAMVGVPITLLGSTTPARHYRLASDELSAAVQFYRDAGWLGDPAGRHAAPTAVPDVRPVPPTRRDRDIEVVLFASDWRPVAGEPGADRWRTFTNNTSVPVRLLRHADGPRPWLVAIHGQGMGRPGDPRMLRVRRLHEELGVNVALPVLPLHGPRSMGFRPEQQLVSNVYLLNNVLGLTQAVWDVRRLLMWLRTDQDASAVGVLGLSLGSYVAGLLSTLEADLACLVAVVPTSDLAHALRIAEPISTNRRALHAALHDERSTQVHHVVSPVARPCLVPHGRRFIIAGQVDRVAPPPGAVALWRHWDEPAIDWRPRGHLTTPRSAAYDDRLTAILTTSGLTAARSR